MSTNHFSSPPLADSLNDHPSPGMNYTFNSTIMIAAMVILFVVVLFVVSLHIYAKWFWRQGTTASRWSTMNVLNASWRNRRHRLELATDESLVANACVGLDPSTVNSLPTFMYEGTIQEAEPLLECAVCLSEFQAHEKGRILPNCKHSFHIDCIDMWFRSHSTCPLCRTPVLSPPPPLPSHEQLAGNLSNHPTPPFLQHLVSSTMAQPRHTGEHNTSAPQWIGPPDFGLQTAGASADAREPLVRQISMPGLELHPQQEEGLANNAGMAPTLHTRTHSACVSLAHIPSYAETLCKDDVAHASLPQMGASGSSSARATLTEMLRQQERVSIARSTSLSSSRALSEDMQASASRQPQKSVSFRMSIKRLVSRELSKGRSKVFPAGQVNAEGEQNTSNVHLPV